jgi:hypothetical protein
MSSVLLLWAGGGGAPPALEVPALEPLTLDDLRGALLARLGVHPDAPVQPEFTFSVDGRPLAPGARVDAAATPLVRATLRGGLRGGKGGFGANLRSSGRSAAAKPTLDFGFCRDLSGRRLRAVNNELRLRKWLSDKEAARRKELGPDYREGATPTGVPGWHLPVPAWAEGVKRKANGDVQMAGAAGGEDRRSRKFKTDLCPQWAAARTGGRRAPPGAPAWWGCPRGRHCEFAHGEGDLKGPAKDAASEARRGRERDAIDHAVAAYAGKAFLYAPLDGSAGGGEGDGLTGPGGGRSMLDSVLQGLGGGGSGSGGSGSAAPTSASRKRQRDEPAASAAADGGDDGDADAVPSSSSPIDPPSRPAWRQHAAFPGGWLVQLPWEADQLAAATAELGADAGGGRTAAAASASSVSGLPDYLLLAAGDDEGEDDEDGGDDGSDAFGADVTYEDGSVAATATVAGRGAFTTLAVAGVAVPVPALPSPGGSDAATASSSSSVYWEVTLLRMPPAAAAGEAPSSSSASSSSSAAAPSAAVQVGWAEAGGAFLRDLLAAQQQQQQQQLQPQPAAATTFAVDGVGDTPSSWGVDLGAQRAWHAAASAAAAAGGSDGDGGWRPYGVGAAPPWREGDVLGCLLAAGAPDGALALSYTLNGQPLGVAFSVPPPPPAAAAAAAAAGPHRHPRQLYPALSLEEGVVVRVNVGAPRGGGPDGFAHPPPAAASVQAAALAWADYVDGSARWEQQRAREAAVAAAAAAPKRQVQAPQQAQEQQATALTAATSSASPAAAAAASDDAEIDIDGDGDGGAPAAAAPTHAFPDGLPVDLSTVHDPVDLHPLGLARLKEELAGRGLKAG